MANGLVSKFLRFWHPVMVASDALMLEGIRRQWVRQRQWGRLRRWAVRKGKGKESAQNGRGALIEGLQKILKPLALSHDGSEWLMSKSKSSCEQLEQGPLDRNPERPCEGKQPSGKEAGVLGRGSGMSSRKSS